MARIRTIKPEFPQSQSMSRVSRDARLLFILLWPQCDDHGKFRGASRMLASVLFPYDNDAPSLIDGWLDELEREGCLQRYSVDGNDYLKIVNWQEHQRVDKPSDSRFPNPRENSRTFASPRENSSRTKDQGPRKGPRTKDQGPESAVALVGESDERRAFIAYNAVCEQVERWPKAQHWNDTRQRALAKRLHECGGIEGWAVALAKARASPFLREKFDGFSLDWMLKAANFTKLLEGNYDVKPGSDSKPSGVAADFARAADLLRDKPYSGI